MACDIGAGGWKPGPEKLSAASVTPKAKNVAVAPLPSAQVTAPLLGADEDSWAKTKHLVLSPNFQLKEQLVVVSFLFLFVCLEVLWLKLGIAC